MLSAKRDVSAARCFSRKMMGADDGRLPFSISVDKSDARGRAKFVASLFGVAA
jgi:transposase-like protein